MNYDSSNLAHAVDETDPVVYVSGLELDDSSFKVSSVTESTFETTRGSTAEAFINDKSLVSFASNVSWQNREDVLHSLLLAQLAATKQYKDENEVLNWFKKYYEVISQIGWVFDKKDFVEYDDSGNLFEMENVILDILGSALGGSYLAIIVKTLEAFKKLSNTDNRILAFERNTHSVSKGAFQIALANETNGIVSITCAAFILSSNETIRKILFFKSGKSKFQLKIASVQCTLSSNVYSLVREEAIRKLGSRATNTLAQLEI